jgi:uncharacterized membrane protein
MKIFLKYIELILTAAGLAIIVLLMAMLPETHQNKWFVVAWVALIVGSLHGVIFFVVRNRQRRVRLEALREAAAMLRDLINNQLTVVRVYSTSHDENLRKLSDEAIMNVSLVINTLSEESLTSWKERYKVALNKNTV